MLKFIPKLKAKIGSVLSSLLSVIGAGGGTTSAVCQTTCTVSPAAVSFFGTSLAFAPLVFLFKYHVILWWVAFLFLAFLIFIYVAEVKRSKLDQALITINTGLIVMGFPYSDLLKMRQFFLFFGGTIALIGLFLLAYRLFPFRYLLFKSG